MLQFILKRLWVMLLTIFCLTFIVFVLTNLKPNLVRLAITQTNVQGTSAEYERWLDSRGYNRSAIVKYGEWLGVVPGWTNEINGVQEGRCKRVNQEVMPTYCGVLQGNFGFSSTFKDDVSTILGTRMVLTGWLMFWVMVVMIPLALVVGILAGMREGSRLDRGLSTFSIATTATPEYVSGVVFIALFASSKFGLSPLLVEWGWLSGGTLLKGSATSAANAITFDNFALPVMTIALYGMGYISRMTRASMAEVMTSQYIRTARLKGVSFTNIVMKHALRNALIAPFTVIMLQFTYLLTGVVIVETLFNYKGIGWTLVQAAQGNDIDLLLGVSIVAVILVLVTQLISDIGYVYLNPRIRIS
jgi:peptide/nickel transport system permease protein